MPDQPDNAGSAGSPDTKSAPADARPTENAPAKKFSPKKVIGWATGIFVTALATFLGAQLTGLFNTVKETAFPETPITVSATIKSGCPLVFRSSQDAVQQEFDAALRRNANAVLPDLAHLDGDETTVEITVQGSAGDPVILSGVDMVVVKRERPNGIAVGQCGGVQPVRTFTANLDEQSPALVPLTGGDPASAPAPDFPFRVSATDPEVFHVIASTRQCDCSWTLQLKWSAHGKTGSVPIDNHGKPFETVASSGLPRYYQSPDNRLLPFG